MGFPGSSEGKESAFNVGDPEEGNGYPPQYCCLENSMERGAVGNSPQGHKSEHDPATDTPVSSNLATFIYNLKIQ